MKNLWLFVVFALAALLYIYVVVSTTPNMTALEKAAQRITKEHRNAETD